MRLQALLLVALVSLGGCLGEWNPDGEEAHDGGTGADIAVSLDEEGFPAGLLAPWSGPPSTVYDNSFLKYRQLKNRVKAVFQDDWVRDGKDLFEANIGLFGGADFTSRYSEVRVASADFLLALSSLAKDVCAVAAQGKKGPFAGVDTAAPIDDGAKPSIDTLFRRILFRPASAQEVSDTLALLKDLTSEGPAPDAWAGACEALLQAPDFLFTLPPSVAEATGADRQRLLLVKVATDLVARPPSEAEQAAFLGGKPLEQVIDAYLDSQEFRDWYFDRMRLRTTSNGTVDSDEPARLWTYLATTGRPFQELFTADYTVSDAWQKASRPPVHGPTGILTMKGFIQGKPGLPHYNYAARVLGDYLGQVFVVSPAVLEMRATAAASSTVDPKSPCFSCHQTLTPLAQQRLRWDDEGTYRDKDEAGAPIDDSDKGLVPGYPFKGQGMAAFAGQAVRKEAFIRRMLNAQMLFLLGRDLRAFEDERVLYKQLWDVALMSQGNLRQIIKTIILSPTYSGR